MERGATRGYAAAIGSAAFVGLFTVLNKWLLAESVPPLTAGAWTYAAAALALLPFALRDGRPHLTRPWLLFAWLLAGSVLGPCFYFLGLKLTSGVQGVLMINLEAIFTALLAFLIFGERLTPSTLAAGLAVVAGGVWISWPSSTSDLLAGPTLGNLLIGLGYLGWATENNLGRLLTAKSPPVPLVCLKALAAALVLATLATLSHQPLAVPWRVVPAILASGAISLGLSLALFYFAMRHIGAGRAGLISATSSLWGVLAAILLLHESLSLQVLAGGLLMLTGLLAFAWETTRASAPVPQSTQSGA